MSEDETAHSQAGADPAVLYESADGTARITLNRPQKLNALGAAVVDGLARAVDTADRSDDVRVVVLAGSGDRAFSSGADLDEVGTRTPFQRRRSSRGDAAQIVRDCQKPVIAMLRGWVLGGGLELATACDIRIAATDARFGYPEIGHGWLPAGGGGTQSLPRLVGTGHAMRLILTGDPIGAAEALAIGLVEATHPPEELERAALDLAHRIATHALEPLILGKAAIRMTERASLDAGIDYERELLALTYYFEGRAEALAAFQGRKRKAGE